MFGEAFKGLIHVSVKKYLYEILKDKYEPNEKLINEICKHLETKQEVESFAKLIGDIFRGGYMVAINQQKNIFEKYNIKFNITDPAEENTKLENKIFK